MRTSMIEPSSPAIQLRRRPHKTFPKLQTEVVTDDTVQNCVNCSKVVSQGDKNESMFGYTSCGCISCGDCTDLTNSWCCFVHFDSGLQQMRRIFGTQCPICLDNTAVLFAGLCGHPVCERCMRLAVSCAPQQAKDIECCRS